MTESIYKKYANNININAESSRISKGDEFILPFVGCREDGNTIKCISDSGEKYLCKKTDSDTFKCASNYNDKIEGQFIKTPFIASVENHSNVTNEIREEHSDFFNKK